MAFNMKEATYGRDRGGISGLITDYNNDLANLRTRLTGDKYQHLLSTIDANWSGADADSFKKAIETEIKNVKSQIDTYQRKIGETLNQSYSDFIKFQSGNKF